MTKRSRYSSRQPTDRPTDRRRGAFFNVAIIKGHFFRLSHLFTAYYRRLLPVSRIPNIISLREEATLIKIIVSKCIHRRSIFGRHAFFWFADEPRPKKPPERESRNTTSYAMLCYALVCFTPVITRVSCLSTSSFSNSSQQSPTDTDIRMSLSKVRRFVVVFGGRLRKCSPGRKLSLDSLEVHLRAMNVRGIKFHTRFNIKKYRV